MADIKFEIKENMPYHLMKVPRLIIKSRIKQFSQMGN
jgi:hypothetical protein